MSLLLGGCVILVLIYVIVMSIRQLWIMNFPWGENVFEEVNGSEIQLFDEANQIIQRLVTLGFEPLVVVKVWLFWRRDQYSFIWYFVDKTKTTYVELSEHKSKNHNSMLGFFSWFPDNALIQTFFPIGETINDPNFSAHFVKEDLEAGYAHHQQVIEQWATRYGAPVAIQNFAQLQPYDAVDRRTHRRRRFRRLTIHLLLMIAVSLVSILIMASSIITDSPLMTGANVYEVIAGLFTHATLLLLCFVVMGVLLYFLSNPPGALDTERKRKKTDGGLF